MTHEFVCFDVLPLNLYAYPLEKNERGNGSLPYPSTGCPIQVVKLGTVELYELGELLFKEFPTIRFVYCPPGISWSKTLESDARTFASKQPYNILT